MTPLDRKSDRAAEFVRLFSEHSRKVLWLIRAAVPTPDTAEEVFQETSVALWENFDDFQSGTNFSAWALQVARNKVLQFRHRQTRDALVFGDALVEDLLADSGPIVDEIGNRRRWLADCFGQLADADRDLITRRYTPGVTSKAVAQEFRRSESYVSKTLARIHQLLFDCISRHEANEQTAL